MKRERRTRLTGVAMERLGEGGQYVLLRYVLWPRGCAYIPSFRYCKSSFRPSGIFSLLKMTAADMFDCVCLYILVGSGVSLTPS